MAYTGQVCPSLLTQ